MANKVLNVILLLLAVQYICAVAIDKAKYQDTYYDPETNVVAQQVDQIGDTSTNTVTFKGTSCHCHKLHCKCCVKIKVQELDFYTHVCGEIHAQSQKETFTAALTLNQKQVLSTSVAVNALPPICVKVADGPDVELCLNFSNLNLVDDKLNFCTVIETRAKLIPTLALHFDCAQM